MRRARAMVAIPGGRRARWAVLVFWLIIVAVTGPLAGRLTGAEKNDASERIVRWLGSLTCQSC